MDLVAYSVLFAYIIIAAKIALNGLWIVSLMLSASRSEGLPAGPILPAKPRAAALAIAVFWPLFLIVGAVYAPRSLDRLILKYLIAWPTRRWRRNTRVAIVTYMKQR